MDHEEICGLFVLVEMFFAVMLAFEAALLRLCAVLKLLFPLKTIDYCRLRLSELGTELWNQNAVSKESVLLCIVISSFNI